MSFNAEGITIDRTFDATPDLVFAAWTEPAQFASWFGADAEVPLDTVKMDVRVGGEWSLTMLVGPDKTEMPWFGEYTEVDPPHRLALIMRDNTGAGTDNVEPLVVTFTALEGGRTAMHFEQRGGNLTEEQYKATEHGWNAFFDKLATGLPA